MILSEIGYCQPCLRAAVVMASAVEFSEVVDVVFQEKTKIFDEFSLVESNLVIFSFSEGSGSCDMAVSTVELE